jgi:Holliday junction resolvase
MRMLEAVGYDTIRSAGSKGSWDVVAIGPENIRLIQVKSNCEPDGVERETMRAYVVPDRVSKEVWIFRDRVATPVIIFIGAV